MVILKITSAGLNTAIDTQNDGLTLRLTKIKFGSGQYNVVDEDPRTAMVNPFLTADFVGGGLEPNSHTLRFNCSFKDTQPRDVYEIGLFTADGVLFAVASSTDEPFLRTSKTLSTVFVGGLKLLSALSNASIEVVLDENGALALQLFGSHEAHPDPHPQYALKNNVEGMNAYSLLQQHVLDLSGLDPNTYYPVTINITNFKDCRFYIDTPLGAFQSPWATHEDSGSFNLYLAWSDRRIGWGENNGLQSIEKFDFSFSDKSPVIQIGQIYFNNFEYFYLRGGTKYICYFEKNLEPVLHTLNYHMEAIGKFGELHTSDLNLINVNDVTQAMYPDPTLLRKRQHLDDPDPHPQYSLETAVNWFINNLQQQIDANASNNGNSNDYLQNLITALQNNKYDKTGGQISGDVNIAGSLVIAGLLASATLNSTLGGTIIDTLFGKLTITNVPNGSGNSQVLNTNSDEFDFNKPLKINGNEGGFLKIVPNDNYLHTGFCNFFTNSNIFNFDEKEVYFGVTSGIWQNGYTSLPNGHILQWGRHDRNDNGGEDGVDITFPIAFRATCYVVDLTRLTASPNGDNSDGGISLYNENIYGFSAHLSTYYGGSVGSLRGFTWIAIGY